MAKINDKYETFETNATLSLNGIISMKEKYHGKNKYYSFISVDRI